MDKAITSSEQTKIVLIVDDTADNLAVLGALLKPLYTVRIAKSGPRALLIAAQEPQPDLILLDIMMPDMDGYEVIKLLKVKPETKEIPVIFITALNSIQDEAKGLDLGAVDYISKPISAPILLSRVATHLDLKIARDMLRDNNAWLEKEVAHRIEQYHLVQDISMRALANLAEARDNETGNHIIRTQSYVNLLAKKLATLPKYSQVLTKETIDNYTKAATLHDIGKVGIPDNVLLKPGKLNSEEWDVMKTHSQIGADAIWRAIKNETDIEAVDFLNVAIKIAKYHHEKWDGSGYPEGLKGEQIPLPARLMALADVFDALISRRPYKAPFSIEETKELILQGKGQHFDPELVDAFEAVYDDFYKVANQYSDNINVDLDKAASY